ncbi:MAG: 1-phosphofructokinase [Erysipelotrichaceae bacterium]|nr:1-phosphofructokinase [Erysipelotrichaceae bacterium]
MIYTVTLNPSLDYIAECKDFTLGATNRTSSEIIYPGGKGINVSIVLSNLGDRTTALGFLAGFTGEHIDSLIKDMGISSRMIRLNEGMSRINLKLKSKEETELNGMGPNINIIDIARLYQKLESITEDDILVLAGSIPPSVSEGLYSDIMERLKEKKIKIVVDATKDLLMNVLDKKPFLIKPNIHELGELFNVKLDSADETLPYALKLKEMGAVNVIISMGKDGAMMVDEYGKSYTMNSPEGKLVNSVGAGDSLVAGFLHKYLETGNYEEALRYGVCTGSASAFSSALATKEEAEKLYREIK